MTDPEPEAYIITETEDGHRLSILRVGDLYYVHTNDRVIGMDAVMAKQVAYGLLALLSGKFSRAVTESHLRLEAERAARQESHRDSAPLPRPPLDAL